MAFLRIDWMRGSDIDEIIIYDWMLGSSGGAALAAKRDPAPQPAPEAAAKRQAWLHRYDWDTGAPPVLDAPVTRRRKVEFGDARDLEQRMWKGVDGIPETTGRESATGSAPSPRRQAASGTSGS